MNSPDTRIRSQRARLATCGLDDLHRFRKILDRLDRRGLCPVGEASRYLRDPESGEITGLHLVLELRDRPGWLVEIPFHLSWALPDEFRVIGEPHLCPGTSTVLDRPVVVVRARKRRSKAA